MLATTRFNPATGWLGHLAAVIALLAATGPNLEAQCPQGWWGAADAEAGDLFGTAVAADGERIVVGAPQGNGAFIDTGAAYVYRLEDGTWIPEQKLTASDGLNSDRFGDSVSIRADRIAVGAPGVRDRGLKSGAIYVFRLDGQSWIEEQKLVAPDGKYGDELGDAVDLYDGVVAAGAPFDDDRGTRSGGVYLFRFDGAAWQWSAKLTASDGAANDLFGSSLALADDLIVVGSPLDDELGSGSGSAYVFRRIDAAWIEEQKLLPSVGDTGDSFGEAVATNGLRVVVGAPDHDAVASRAGALFSFAHDGAVWSEEQMIVGDDAQANEFLGTAVALSGTLLAAGGPGANGLSGQVRTFAHDGVSWQPDGVVATLDPESGDLFGDAVAASGTLLAAATPFDDAFGVDSGSVIAYRDALWANYGEGWPGTGGIPALTLQDDPMLGGSIALEMGNSAGTDTTAALLIGFDEARIETLLEGTILLVPHTLIPLALPESGLVLSVDLDCDPLLFSITLYLQTLVVDAGASWSLAFSRGLRMTLGSF